MQAISRIDRPGFSAADKSAVGDLPRDAGTRRGWVRVPSRHPFQSHPES